MDARGVENMLDRMTRMNISKDRKSTRPSRKPQSIYKPVKPISKPKASTNPKKPKTSTNPKKPKTYLKTNMQSIMNAKLKKGNLLSVRQYLYSTKGQTYGLTKANVGVYGSENRFRKEMFTQKELNKLLSAASKLKK